MAPLMPKATAMWLIDNTTLTFQQIAEFCGLHALEIEAMADGEGQQVAGQSPVQNRLLTAEEIKRCEDDHTARLNAIKSDLPKSPSRSKGPRYTPISKRGDKPDAIAWLLKQHPELNDTVISKLVGTTRTTIQSVRDKTHHNSANLQPRSPVELGLCNFVEFEAAVDKARAQLQKEGKWNPEAQIEPEEKDQSSEAPSSGFDFSNFLRNTSNS